MTSLARHYRVLIAVMAAALAITLIAGVFAIDRLVSRTEQAQATAQVDRIMTELASRQPSMGPLAPIDEIDRRLLEQGGSAQAPVLSVRRRDGRVITGNLAQWPAIPAYDTPFELRAGGSGSGSIAVVRRFGEEFEVLVAQPLVTHDTIRSALLMLLLAGLLVNLLVWTLVVRRTLRRNEAIVGSLATSLDAAAGGAVWQRLPEPDDPVFARIVRRINLLLSNVELGQESLRQIGANIAHELATPLGKAADLAEELAAARPDDQRLDALAAQLDAMEETFDGLLALARIETGRGGCDEFSIFDLKDAAKDACELFDEHAREANVELVKSLQSAPVFGDPWLVRSAIGNLVSNAIRYGASGGQVFVGTCLDQGMSRVSIVDSGPGLSRSLSKSAAAPPDAQEPATGHGLGLKLVRAIAMRHNAGVRLDECNPGLSASLMFPCETRR
ncbi:hypothetical protein CD351_02525 [Erythrobacter sp. KY5]|uniref:sensor histidine kinase n=1 Tax=Erythrobacter sp. KY5 TaxID=2011159 RepID=UPI000DBF30EA|nr:HAMP domain-containing sensor histidine kinase [Erythrobacter sp. KY5]AWW73298.1 hypothetical protein CD351_02525 [Erythrobacter sp. KY5]